MIEVRRLTDASWAALTSNVHEPAACWILKRIGYGELALGQRVSEDSRMNIAERAKAMVIQLETLRDVEQLASNRIVLARSDCIAAWDALIAADSTLHPAARRKLQRRIDAIDDWLVDQGK